MGHEKNHRFVFYMIRMKECNELLIIEDHLDRHIDLKAVGFGVRVRKVRKSRDPDVVEGHAGRHGVRGSSGVPGTESVRSRLRDYRRNHLLCQGENRRRVIIITTTNRK